MAVRIGGGKLDHPLAEAKDSRKVIGELPQDVFKALGEIAYWLNSVHATEGFRLDRRLQLIEELEQFARPRVRKLAPDYMPLRQQKFHENRLWVAQADFWRLTGACYVQCVAEFQADAPGASTIKSRLPAIVGRALRAIGQQLKWLMLRYGPVDPALWGHVGNLYAFAEAGGFADAEVELYAAEQDRSSARHELLRILMFNVGSVGSLQPEKIEIAERTVARFAHGFLLEATPEAGCTHVFDLALRNPPARPHGASMEASMRYFGAGGAFDELVRLLPVLRREGALPSGIDLGGSYDAMAVAEVWHHLLLYWSLKAPERGAIRQAASVRLTVLQGFAKVIYNLDSATGADVQPGADSLGADSESWVAENASDGGYGAVVPGAKSDWVQIGALLGLRREGEKHWGVGVIRRLLRDREFNRHVGIELLTRAAIPVRVSPSGPLSPTNAVRDNDPGILLVRQPDANRRVRLLLRADSYTPDQPIELHARGQVFRLAPHELLEHGAEFDLAHYTVLERIA